MSRMAGLVKELQDDYGKIKLAVAVGFIALMGFSVLAVLLGWVPADNPVAVQAIGGFNLIVGLIIAFLFRSKEKQTNISTSTGSVNVPS